MEQVKTKKVKKEEPPYFLKPNLEPMSPHTLRLRRNLIAYSIITFSYALGSKYIDVNGSSFLGLKFKNMPECYISWGLLIATLYSLIYFAWSASNHYYENKFRLTGIKVLSVFEQASDTSGVIDPNVDDDNDSTLFSWFVGRNNLKKEFTEEEEKSENDYIKHALRRFEESFSHHQRSQALKWILIDLGLPSFMGIVALSSILWHLFIETHIPFRTLVDFNWLNLLIS